jgi:hypothetical protein
MQGVGGVHRQPLPQLVGDNQGRINGFRPTGDDVPFAQVLIQSCFTSFFDLWRESAEVFAGFVNCQRRNGHSLFSPRQPTKRSFGSSERTGILSRNHAVRRESFNAKTQRREGAKRILPLAVRVTKRGALVKEPDSLSALASLRLRAFALNPDCIVTAESARTVAKRNLRPDVSSRFFRAMDDQQVVGDCGRFVQAF